MKRNKRAPIEDTTRSRSMAQLRKIKLLCQDLREGTRKIPVCHKLDI